MRGGWCINQRIGARRSARLWPRTSVANTASDTRQQAARAVRQPSGPPRRTIRCRLHHWSARNDSPVLPFHDQDMHPGGDRAVN